MTTPHTPKPAELLESLDRHFMLCGFLDSTQLRAHKAQGICHQCSARAETLRLARERELALAGRGAADRHAGE